MQDVGLEPLLERVIAVPKSAFAAKGERTTPLRHYETMAVVRPLGASPRRITVVEDVVTKGAALLAAASLLQEAFPEAEVRAFALVRTLYSEHFQAIVDPVVGRIVLHGDNSRREP